MNLDKELGLVLPPGANGVEPIERQLKPTVHTLDMATSQILKEYMQFSEQHALGHTALINMPILWVVGIDGKVRFAMEEIWSTATRELLYSRPKGGVVPTGAAKLGHPALLPAGQENARIGGELSYDENWDEGSKWVLTNSSGRYGRRATDRAEHLAAVAGIFKGFGIYVSVGFNL